MRAACLRRVSPSLLCLSLLGCGIQEQRYVIENQAVVLTEDAAPVVPADGDEDAIFLVERRFELPIEPPGDNTLQSLTEKAQGMNLPFPRLPWVEQSDLSMTLDYVLANLSNDPVTAGIVINGANEFFEYAPGPEDFQQWERRVELTPRQRLTGSISELEMDEIAIDLATVVNGAPNSNQVVQFQSQSGRDPRVKAFIPKVVPGLIALRAGVLSNQAANVVLEISLRVQDQGDRLAKRGEERWEQPAPTLFVPVVPEEDP